MSDKPGRNDPCYCGSGKKYKKCHMPIDQERDRERRSREMAARFLREDIPDFAQDEAFAVPFAKALPLFWNGLYTLENADEMAPDEARIFFDWFAFDYIPEDGVRVLEAYREEMWDELSSHQQETLTAWLGAGPLAGYELTGYEGQTLYLRDITTDEAYEVFEPAGHGNIQTGDVIIARLVPVQEHLEFTTDVPFIPAAEVVDLPEKLAATEEVYRAEHPDATHADFMRRHNYMLAQHALEQAEEAGRPPVARLDPNRPDKNPQSVTQQIRRVVRR